MKISLLRFVAVALFIDMAGIARAQIYIATSGANTIAAYNFDGSVINTALISGLSNPYGVAVSGADLYVANYNGGVGKYTTAGTTVNAALITGLNNPTGVAVAGTDLFVAVFNGATVGKYTTAGATVDATFITAGVSFPYQAVVSGSNVYVVNNAGGGNPTVGVFDASTGAIGSSALVSSGLNAAASLAVSGSYIYVSNYFIGTIGKFDAVTGAPVDTAFISGLDHPFGIALSGGNLYVGNNGNGTIGVYDAATGATVNATLISGLPAALGIAVTPIPEPSTYAALAGVAMLGFAAWRRKCVLAVRANS